MGKTLMDGTEQLLFENTELGEFGGYVFLDKLQTGEIGQETSEVLLQAGGETVLGSYNKIDKYNSNIAWLGGKKQGTTNLRIMKVNLLTGEINLITPAVGGNRGYPLDDDATQVYVPDSDAGNLIVVKKSDLTTKNFNPHGAGNPIIVTVHPATGMVWYVVGGAVLSKVGFFNPSTEEFTSYDYESLGSWADYANVVNDKLYFILKDGGYLGKFNCTTQAYEEFQVADDTSYPTTFINQMVYDPVRNCIWISVYGKGRIIKFDLTSETKTDYNVSAISGNALDGCGLLGDRVLWTTYDYPNKWFVWRPEDGVPSAETVTSVTQTFADATCRLAAIDCSFKPIGNRAIATEQKAGDFHYRIAVLNLTVTLDSVTMRTYIKDIEEDTYKKHAEQVFSGALSCPAIRIEPIIGKVGLKVTLQQTSGTYREVTHMWFKR